MDGNASPTPNNDDQRDKRAPDTAVSHVREDSRLLLSPFLTAPITTLLSAGSIARLRQRPEKLGPKLRVSAQYFIICVDYNKLDRKGYRTRHQFRSRNRLSVNADIAYGHGYA